MAYKAEIVVKGGKPPQCVYELRIGEGKLTGPNHEGIVIATQSYGVMPPQWMTRTVKAFERAKPKDELMARLIASVEKVKKE